jgi:hypothetical protein
MKKLQVLRQTIPVFMRIIPVLAEKQFLSKSDIKLVGISNLQNKKGPLYADL